MSEVESAPTVDVDRLPPTQYLILECLAARVRTGEHLWSFPDRVKPQLRELASAGLIGWQSSPAPGACHAWFTDTGRKLFVTEGFETPHARELSVAQRTASEAVERQLVLVQENQQLRAELGRFVRAMAGGLMIQHSCGITFVEPADGSRPGPCAWCQGEQGDVWLPLYVRTPAPEGSGALPSVGGEAAR